MKSLKILLIGIAITGITSCKKNQLATVNAPNDDAATIIAESLATNNYGMSYFTQDVSSNAMQLSNNSSANCGVTVTDSAVRKNSLGSNATYNYKLKYTNKLTCNTAGLPDNVTGTLSYKGNFNGQRIASENNGIITYRVAGLTQTADNHVLNGEYKSTNYYKLKSDTTNKGTANIYLSVKNLIVSKANHTIIGGTAMAIITGSSSKKASFTYNGTLTFNTSLSATLTLNGDDYNIDLTTGTAVKK